MNPPDHYRTDGRGEKVEDISENSSGAGGLCLHYQDDEANNSGQTTAWIKENDNDWVKGPDGEAMVQYHGIRET